jgi:3-deoxy-D-arabino-heptulosonate 7-phosphate (DAHP) synthase
MTVVVEISIGELIDKITILERKLEKIKDETKQRNIAREHEMLVLATPKAVEDDEKVAALRQELTAVNAELWRVEDELRARERAKAFDSDFVALARLVYVNNDKRAALKRSINEITNSGFGEEKSYEAY